MGMKPRNFQVLFILLTLGSVIVSTLVFFIVAFHIGSDSIKHEAMRTVGATADGKVRGLQYRLNWQKERLSAFLEMEVPRCEKGNPKQVASCMRTSLNQFMEMQNSKALYLETSNLKTGMLTGQPTGELVFDPGMKEGQMARFYSGGGPNPYYVIQEESADHRIRIIAEFSAKIIVPIFSVETLGEKGESFLVDPKGFFLTPPEYHVESGKSRPIDAKPMIMCLGGKSGEIVGLDYSGTPIIHGYRYIPEIGGGCIMVHIDQQEAFAELDHFTKKWWSAALILWAVLGVVTYLISRTLSKQLNDNIKNVEDSWRHLLSFATETPVSMAMFDKDMNYICASDQWIRTMGLEGMIVVGRNYYDLSPDTNEEWRSIHRHCLTGASEGRNEDPKIGEDGNVLWSSWQIVPWRDARGVVGGIIMHIEDITARKHIESEIRKSESTVRALINASNDMVYLLDSNGVILEANYSGATVMDKAFPRDIVGLSIFTLLSPELAETYRKKGGEVITTGEPVSFEVEWLGQYMNLTIYPVFDQKQQVTKLAVYAQDITALKRADQEYKTIKSTSGDGFWVSDMSGKFVDVNETYCAIIGYSLEELLRMSIADVEANERPEDTANHIKKVMETGFDRFETRHKRKDGTLINVEISVTHNKLLGGHLYVFIRDINELKKNELILKRAYEEYQTIIRTSHDGFCVFDRNLKFLDANEAYCNAIGYSREELLNMTIDDVKPSQDRKMTPVNVDSIIRKRFNMFEATHLSKGGVTIQFEVSSTFDDYMGGRFYSFFRDITDRKKNELALKRAYEEYQTIIHTTTDGFYIVDAQLRFVEVNDAYCDVIGYSREELLSMRIDDVKVFEERVETPANMSKIKKSKFFRFESTHRRKDGTPMLMEITSTFDEYMGGRFYTFARDISESKKNELALKRAAAEYQTIIRTTTDGFTIVDMEGRFIEVNAAYCDAMGYSREEFLKMSLYDVRPPLKAHEVDVNMTNIMKKKFDRFESTQIRKNGSLVNMEVTAAFDEYMGGRFYSFIRDITYRRKAQEELYRMNNELRERTMQAEEANKAKSEFLANMSHEIRTPLNAIIGLTHILDRTALNIRQKDQLAKVHSSAELLLGIINDVLDFSKIEAGMMEIESVPFDLGDILEHLSSIVSVQARENNTELLYTVSPEVPRQLVGDPLRFSQVILNLLSNAVKFTKKGQVVLSASIVSASDLGRGAMMRFSVTDSGIGITEEQMKKLFLPFTQADASTTRRYGGTGLGLVLCKKLVELMKGTIQAKSEPGKGSVFSIEIPFGFQEGAYPACPLVPEELHGMRVLVVDDNIIALGIMRGMLESFSFQVTALDSVKAAVEELERSTLSQETTYRMVLMDWKMPDMDGIKGAKLIIKDKKITNIPVILMASAFGDEATAELAMEAGIKHFLHKPIQSSTLLNVIFDAFNIEGFASDRRAITRDKTDLLTAVRGSNVLLVDDNAINREVAQTLLVGVGMVVVVAKSGRESIDILESSTMPFDAVFMDIQMPDMDGYEATRIIRRNPRFHDLPIIALTAHAMVEDKRICLDAGMNDHIGKPIQVETLANILVKWIAQKYVPVGMADNKDAPAQIPDIEKAVSGGEEANLLPDSLPGLDLVHFIRRVGGDQVLALRLLRTFLTDQAGAAEKVYLALGKQDVGAIAHIAHLIKGIAGNIAATELQRAANALEGAAINRDLSAVAKNAEGFKKELMLVLQSVSLLNSVSSNEKAADGAVAFDSSAFKGLCEELYDLLRKHSMKSEPLLKSVTDMVRGTEFESGMEKVSHYSNRFEFEKAAEELEGILNSGLKP